jgi:8-oxo-dGTP pyrophosphatase MutT (NUDIX family)
MFIEKISERLKQPLPGLAAQWEMTNQAATMEEALERYQNLPEDHRLASVMILLYLKNGDWHTALMQRPPSPYAHGNQVSLPGGMREETDPNHAHTALRETHEEFGIAPEKVQLLGGISPIYIPVSNFLVHPFVGYLSESPHFQQDAQEVVEILETPLKHLLEPARKKIQPLLDIGRGVTLKNVPYFDLHERLVWGATAMILNEFVCILRETPYLCGASAKNESF